MERYIIQFKGRFGWEDVKIFFDKELCLVNFKQLREKGFHVRVIMVIYK